MCPPKTMYSNKEGRESIKVFLVAGSAGDGEGAHLRQRRWAFKAGGWMQAGAEGKEPQDENTGKEARVRASRELCDPGSRAQQEATRPLRRHAEWGTIPAAVHKGQGAFPTDHGTLGRPGAWRSVHSSHLLIAGIGPQERQAAFPCHSRSQAMPLPTAVSTRPSPSPRGRGGRLPTVPHHPLSQRLSGHVAPSSALLVAS